MSGNRPRTIEFIAIGSIIGRGPRSAGL